MTVAAFRTICTGLLAIMIVFVVGGMAISDKDIYGLVFLCVTVPGLLVMSAINAAIPLALSDEQYVVVSMVTGLLVWCATIGTLALVVRQRQIGLSR